MAFLVLATPPALAVEGEIVQAAGALAVGACAGLAVGIMRADTHTRIQSYAGSETSAFKPVVTASRDHGDGRSTHAVFSPALMSELPAVSRAIVQKSQASSSSASDSDREKQLEERLEREREKHQQELQKEREKREHERERHQQELQQERERLQQEREKRDQEREKRDLEREKQQRELKEEREKQQRELKEEREKHQQQLEELRKQLEAKHKEQIDASKQSSKEHAETLAESKKAVTHTKLQWLVGGGITLGLSDKISSLVASAWQYLNTIHPDPHHTPQHEAPPQASPSPTPTPSPQSGWEPPSHTPPQPLVEKRRGTLEEMLEYHAFTPEELSAERARNQDRGHYRDFGRGR